MTTLKFSDKHIMGHELGPDSPFPAITDPMPYSSQSNLSEDEGLFLDYGMFSDVLPYTMQDNYDGAFKELSFRSAILENDYLRAEIVIDLGARLWSIYDKTAKRELLLNNTQFLPGNLAIRNAWFAGGVEWNIGRRGHDQQTCSPRFAAQLTADDGTPVLRIYEMARDRLTPFQIDFMLPEDSRFLFVRPRIFNPNKDVVPMYWWSNIAVPETPGCRVVVPTNETYANAYHNGHHALSKITVPDGEGFDATYPMNFPVAKDHFYKIPETSRKYETVFYPDGHGIAHCSTNRLQGRKLFVWGQTHGGHHWQRKLMAPDCPDYLEIQGGLAHTQQECLPMPPNTAWEWLEAYGPVQAAPEDIFNDWNKAVNTVTRLLDNVIPQKQLDKILADTKKLALKTADPVCCGSDFAALEELRRGCKLTPNLDFGTVSKMQKDWTDLLAGKKLDSKPPRSFMIQDEWLKLLSDLPEKNWKAWYLMALHYLRKQDFRLMQNALNHSLKLERNAWNEQANAYCLNARGKHAEAARAFSRALEMKSDCVSLAKDILRQLLLLKEYPRVISLWKNLTPAVRKSPMVQFLYASALAHSGKLLEAEKIIMQDGGLELPDIREGEISIAELYIFIQLEKAKSEGRILKREDIQVPYPLDFRMS